MSVDPLKFFNDAIDLAAYTTSKIEKPIPRQCPPEIFFRLGCNPSSEGSCYLEYGDVKVTCSVNGPLEVRQDGQLVTFVRFAPFIRWTQYDTKSGTEKRLNKLLLSALEPSVLLHCFPRGKYEISCTVLDSGCDALDLWNIGDCLAALVTVAGLALSDASVQMYDIPVGVNIDLSTIHSPAEGQLTVAFLPRLRQISMLHSADTRIQNMQDLKKALDLSTECCIKLSNTIRQCLSTECGGDS